MNKIRAFIFCSSVLLVAWLSASYTSRLDAPRLTPGTGTTADAPAERSKSIEENNRPNTTASLSGMR